MERHLENRYMYNIFHISIIKYLYHVLLQLGKLADDIMPNREMDNFKLK